MTDDSRHLAVQYERLVHNRALLVATHVTLASVVAAAYLSQLHLWQRTYWSRVGLSIVFTLVAPLFPYLVSAIHSLSLVTAKRLRLNAFIVFLVITTVVIASLLLGNFGSVSWGTLLAVVVGQTVAYVWGANILLKVSDAL